MCEGHDEEERGSFIYLKKKEELLFPRPLGVMSMYCLLSYHNKIKLI